MTKKQSVDLALIPNDRKSMSHNDRRARYCINSAYDRNQGELVGCRKWGLASQNRELSGVCLVRM